MLEGLMQNDFPLTVQHPLDRMRTLYADREVVTLEDASLLPGGGVTRATFGEVSERVDRLARALQTLGLERGDRVGTFGWNSQRHFELYFAVPCSGMVLHTVNIRLFAEQIVYIVNHAEDQVVFVDDTLLGLLAPLADQMPTVKHFVIMGSQPPDGDTPPELPNVLRYEELLEQAGPGPFDYPALDEREAAALCYTSGTTGNPKGVLYSHRSVSLHATSQCMVDSVAISTADRIIPIVPMFHVNAWGLPFAAALTGADLVMPTRFLQAAPLAALIAAEQVTTIAGVPTVMADLLRYADEHDDVDLSSMTRGLCGGSAVPRALIEGYEKRHGIRVVQAWGMTETSPVCSVAVPPPDASEEHAWELRAGQGRVLPWVEMRVMGDDGVQPWDGESVGEIQVRGPWIASDYFHGADGVADDDKFDGEWLKTGDIGAMDRQGYVQLTDRAKDLIKSGGEWISSVELENEIMEHELVLEAAVIAKPDNKWAERPLACVVVVEGATLDAADVVAHLEPRVAKWWIPEEIVFIDKVPKTSVGKFDKKVLRAQLQAGDLIPR